MFLLVWVASLGSLRAATPAVDPLAVRRHWAFQPLPAPAAGAASATIDRLIARRLASAGLRPAGPADRVTLIRRAAFLLTGLPPTPGEIQAFLNDRRPDAWGRVVDHYLGSPRYAERWAKHWLDAAGYADSNGYFNADSDRPLAYRYRDYVIRSHAADKPFNEFVREQIAGDELSGWKPGEPATQRIQELLEATHFLRNGQDGSGESDGNPDEVRLDRYYALESSLQILGTSLLGLTVQCAKCHDHKFEPVTQRDYYSLQAFLYPAFNVDRWVKPADRVVQAPLPGEMESWQANEKEIAAAVAAHQEGLRTWAASHRPAGRILFRDGFDDPALLSQRWSATAPGDDSPGGSPSVKLGAADGPSARVVDGRLQVVEGGGSGDRWLVTRQAFEWKPAVTGEWIQVTFDLSASSLGATGSPAERIGYFIAAHDFDDNGSVAGGNILVDGHPTAESAVVLDYPGADSRRLGGIGGRGYMPGHRYGVRITRNSSTVFTMQHWVDGAEEGKSLELTAGDLPSGGFGFEYCCGRSFVVDNVEVEASRGEDPAWAAAQREFADGISVRRREVDARVRELQSRRKPKPGVIAWVSDVTSDPPEVRLLKRGSPKTPGERVTAEFPGFLKVPDAGGGVAPEGSSRHLGTGRRLALAQWLTRPGSRQEGLLARVTMNRVWQQFFGEGIAATPDNLGLSGSRPGNPELLDELAARFVHSGWSLKSMHRAILASRTFQQASAAQGRGLEHDPGNHLLWRHPIRRLDAESIRDAMLAASGKLGLKSSGPYVPTPRQASGEVLPDEGSADGFSRSIFLQQRRTQVPTFLGNFDAPSMVFNCTRRADTTMPLQSLSLLNSEFSLRRGEDLAERVAREGGNDPRSRIRLAFLLVAGRDPSASESRSSLAFLASQKAAYSGRKDADRRTWADFCQSLFGLNAFLYLE